MDDKFFGVTIKTGEENGVPFRELIEAPADTDIPVFVSHEPVNYLITDPALLAHLKGIDDALASAGGGGGGGSSDYINGATFDPATGILTLTGEGSAGATVNLDGRYSDVLEYLELVDFPAVGEIGRLYVATALNSIYRWSGSEYILLNNTPVSSVEEILFLDTFTDTDGVLLTAHTPDTGFGWTIRSGTEPTITSNSMDSGGTGVFTCDSTQSDVTIQARVTNGSSQNSPGIVFRHSGAGGSFPYFLLHFDDSTITLYAPTLISLGSNNTLGSNVNNTREVLIELSGNSIKIIIDDVILFDVQSAVQSTNTLHGIRYYNAAASVDRFAVLSPGVSSLLPIPQAGLIFALNAADTTSLYSDIAKTTLATEGERVAVWEDISGNGNDWTQTVFAARPIYKAQATTVHFDSATATSIPDKYLVGPDISDWSEGTFSARVQNISLNSGAIWGTTTTNNSITLNHWNGYITFGNSTRRSRSNPGSTLMNYEEHVSVATGQEVYVNGSLFDSDTIGTIGFRSDPVLGCGIRSGVPQYSGEFEYIRMVGYNRVLAAAERILVDDWLLNGSTVTQAPTSDGVDWTNATEDLKTTGTIEGAGGLTNTPVDGGYF